MKNPGNISNASSVIAQFPKPEYIVHLPQWAKSLLEAWRLNPLRLEGPSALDGKQHDPENMALDTSLPYELLKPWQDQVLYLYEPGYTLMLESKPAELIGLYLNINPTTLQMVLEESLFVDSGFYALNLHWGPGSLAQFAELNPEHDLDMLKGILGLLNILTQMIEEKL